MNTQLTAQELFIPLNAIRGAVENKQTLPILAHVLIQIKDNLLTLTTTDMEIEMKYTHKVKAQKDVSFTVNAKDLIDIITKLDEKTLIEFTIEKTKVYIKVNRSSFELNTFNHQDFPSLPKIKNDNTIKIKHQALKTLIEKTSFSMGNNDIRAYLNGLYFEVDKNTIIAVATDGHRLSIGTVKQKNKLNDKNTLIIPRKAVVELTKIISEDKSKSDNQDNDIEIHIDDNYFYLKDDNIHIVSRLIDGNFPNYAQVIPSNHDNTVHINREEFLDNLRQASIFVGQRKGVKLLFKKTLLYISAQSEKGNAKTQVKIKNFDKEIEIGFNASYLISILEKLNSSTINMIISADENQSCLLNSDDDKSYQYVVMPMKI